MSGGHYPSSFHHIQPSPDFIAPRHRLPLIPPQRPPSTYNPPSSISHAHTSHTSWMNKTNYQNFHENASYYSQSSPKNYSPASRGVSNEESNWSETPFSNSTSVTNTVYRGPPENNKMESRICSNVYSKDDVQQESMDLSSAAHVPTITSPKADTETSASSVNGNPDNDEVRKDHSTSINGATLLQNIKQTSPVKEGVSVIAPNPLREKSSHIVSVESIIKSIQPALHEPVIKSSKESVEEIVKITKQEKAVIPPDHVESILETMFHSDCKSSVTSAVSSVIVTAQSCKTPDFRAESVEKILKSPSPERSDGLSLESDSELNSTELDSTRGDEPSLVQSTKTDLTSESKSDSSHLPKSICDVDDNDAKKISEQHPTSKTECAKSDTQPESIPDLVTEKIDDKVMKSIDEQLSLMNEAENNSIRENDKSDQPVVSTDGTTDISNKTKKNDITDSVAKQEYLRKLEEDHIVVELDLEKCKKPTDEPNTKQERLVKGKNRKEEITYVEVESELEKMFAGIEDTEVSEIDGDPLNALPIDSSITDTSKIDASNVTSDISFSQPANTAENLPAPMKSNKKKSSKKSKSASAKKDTKSKHSATSKDNASSDGVICKRVPVIHVEGSKENPISVQIINSIKSEEDDISDAKTAKRKQGKCDKVNKRFAASNRVKNYDPESSDESWICIFCKQSAHSPGVAGEPTGELFGPYFIKDPYQPDIDSDSKRHSRKTDHLNDQVKKKKLKKKSKKQKRSLSLESNHNVSSAPERKSMEIWAHENCFIWASGIHLIGSKLMGLENAVIESLQTLCAYCGQSGASVGCRTRRCRSLVHYSCALHLGWKLNPETFIAACNLHKGTH